MRFVFGNTEKRQKSERSKWKKPSWNLLDKDSSEMHAINPYVIHMVH